MARGSVTLRRRGPQIQAPEGGGLTEGSGSYTIFFHDPNGVCLEIFAEPLTVSQYRQRAAAQNAGL